MKSKSIEQLANEVAELLLSGNHPNLAVLREQYDRADYEIRTTGVGFFVEFTVPADVDPIPVSEDFQLGGVQADVDELEYGMGFVLFVRDGRISLLEGYTYEEPLPEAVTNVSVDYTSGERDEDTLFPD